MLMRPSSMSFWTKDRDRPSSTETRKRSSRCPLKSDGTVHAWGTFHQDDVPLPNRGYLAISANR